MNKLWFAALVVISIVLGVYVFHREQNDGNQGGQLDHLSAIPSLNPRPISSGASSGGALPPSLPENEVPSWKQEFESLTEQMQGLSTNPEATDEEITEFSEQLNLNQLNELVQTVLSKHSSGDEKLLATELLARSPLPGSIDLLKQIVTTAVTEISNNPYLQQEQKALQMQAIEGIGNKTNSPQIATKALKELAQSTEDSVLADRIQRTLWALKGKAPKPEEQDKEALKKLLVGRE